MVFWEDECCDIVEGDERRAWSNASNEIAGFSESSTPVNIKIIIVIIIMVQPFEWVFEFERIQVQGSPPRQLKIILNLSTWSSP